MLSEIHSQKPLIQIISSSTVSIAGLVSVKPRWAEQNGGDTGIKSSGKQPIHHVGFVGCCLESERRRVHLLTSFKASLGKTVMNNKKRSLSREWGDGGAMGHRLV